MKHKRKLRAILLALTVAVMAVLLTACEGLPFMVSFPLYDGDDFDRPGLDVTEYRPIEEADGVSVPAGMTLCFGGTCADAFAQEIFLTQGLSVSMRRNNGKQDLTGLNQKDYTGGAFSTLYRTGYRYLYLIRNTSAAPITMSVSTAPSQTLRVGDNAITTKKYNTYSTFRVPSTGTYDVVLSGWTSHLTAVDFFGDDAQNHYRLTKKNDSTSQHYRMYLREGEDLFVMLRSSAEGSLSVKISEHTSEYAWYEGSNPTANGTFHLRRNSTPSGALTLRKGAEVLNGTLTVSGTGLTVGNGAIKAEERTQLSIATSYFGYVQMSDQSGNKVDHELIVEIIPKTTPTLYAMTSVTTNCLFGIKNIEALAHGTEQEVVSIAVEITNGKKTVEQVIKTEEAELIYIAPEGRWADGERLTLRIKSVTYTVGGRTVTYTAEYYPEIVTGETITLVKD